MVIEKDLFVFRGLISRFSKKTITTLKVSKLVDLYQTHITWSKLGTFMFDLEEMEWSINTPITGPKM